MRHAAFAVPGALTTPTGGYAYDRRIIAELCTLGWSIDVIDLGSEFPRPSDAARLAAHARLAALSRDHPIVVDGLAFGALPDVAAALAPSHRLFALVHHPLAREIGLSREESETLRISEQKALAAARRVIVTSATTAGMIVSDYGVPPDRVAVVRPGCDRRPDDLQETDTSRADSPVRLLAVGAMVPRKGYDVLIAALAPLRHLSWRLTIVGDLTRAPETVSRVKADIARFDLHDRVILAGAVPDERLAALFADSDLFALASRFEGYGMAFAEAIAHGLPIVATEGGAITETIPATARILVETDDVAALSAALRRLIEDPEERRHLAAGARRAAAELPSWRQSAVLFGTVLETAR